MGGLIAVFIACAIAGVIWYSLARAERERQRRAGLALLARLNRMSFVQDDPAVIAGRYNGVAEIGRGHNQYAEDVLQLDVPPVVAFRWHYCTWETRTVTRNNQTVTETYEETHWRQYLIVELGGVFPSLTLRHEGLFDKLAGLVGVHDINFESNEFSRAYFCKSEDKAFAYALIHPQMIEFLLPRRVTMTVDGPLLLIDLAGTPFDAPGLCRSLNLAAGIVNRVPPFVWQDYGKTPAITLPAFKAPEPASLSLKR